MNVYVLLVDSGCDDGCDEIAGTFASRAAAISARNDEVNLEIARLARRHKDLAHLAACRKAETARYSIRPIELRL